MILNFFSLWILVVHILSLINPRDATLASLSISIYSRWRPRWKPIISKKNCVIWKKCLQPIFSLKLLAMTLESSYRHLAHNNNVKQNKNLGKMAAKMTVYYKNIRKFPPTPANSRDLHEKC